MKKHPDYPLNVLENVVSLSVDGEPDLPCSPACTILITISEQVCCRLRARFFRTLLI